MASIPYEDDGSPVCVRQLVTRAHGSKGLWLGVVQQSGPRFCIARAMLRNKIRDAVLHCRLHPMSQLHRNWLAQMT